MPGILGNAIQESAQTVGNSAVALGSNGFNGRAGIVVFNNGGGGTLFVGGPNVTSATGMAINSNSAPVTFSTPEGAAVYGVASLAGTLVRVIEF